MYIRMASSTCSLDDSVLTFSAENLLSMHIIIILQCLNNIANIVYIYLH